MDHTIARITENLVARITGPMRLRLALQPAMAIFFAIRDGLKDAQHGKPAYFWGLFTDKGEREAMLKTGWKSIGKVFLFAIALDVVYHIIAHRWVYPGEAVLVAIILAIVPYLVARGAVNRIARRRSKNRSSTRDPKLSARDRLVLEYSDSHSTVLGLSLSRFVIAHLATFTHGSGSKHVGKWDVALLQ